MSQPTTETHQTSLYQRIRLSIMLFLSSLILLAAIGYLFIYKHSNQYQQATQQLSSAVHPAIELQVTIQRNLQLVNQFNEHPSPQQRDLFLTRSEQVKQLFEQQVVAPLPPHQLRYYQSAYKEWRHAQRIAQKLFANESPADPTVAQRNLKRYYEHLLRTHYLLDTLQLELEQDVESRLSEAQAQQQSNHWFIVAVFIVSFCIALLAALYLIRQVITPIRALANWSLHFFQGKQTGPLPSSNTRELSQLADTLNHMSQLLADEQKAVRQLSLKDELTGLHNKRAFELRLQEEFERHERYHHCVSVLILDIDHFQTLYNQYSRETCDQLLIALSEILTQQLRPTDYLARYSFDKFTVIIPEVDEHGAYATAERIRHRVSEEVFSLDGHSSGITVSAGIAILKDKLTTPEHLLKQAEEALSEAKKRGSNQAVRAW